MTAWEVIGIPRGSDPQEIKAAYRRRMMACHPDKGGSEEEAKMVNKAYEMLTKPQPEPVRVFYQRPTVIIRVFSGYGYSSNANTTTTGTWPW
jgi:preprotein translocase subunit Sec63